MAITVVGSVNLDFVVRVERLPVPGETLTDATFERHPGGKGANQALACRRLGAEVGLVACVGDDPLADEATALLSEAGVDLTALRRGVDAPTGVAFITVDKGGENQIVVAPGANRRLRPEHLDLGRAEAVLCQLEIPIETVAEAARQCRGLFALNAAPARPVGPEVLARADLLIVNQVEHATLAPLLEGFQGLLAVTEGASGARLLRRGEVVARACPPPVEPVDTVGAGDAFTAALLVGLLEGRGEQTALERACAAGALATTVRGAQPSLPTRARLDEVTGR